MGNDKASQPQRPQNTPFYASVCLEALAGSPLANKISLGGAFGLMHYFEYRPTHDVDAWWMPSARGDDRKQVVSLLEAALQSFGQVQTRSWGDVTSVELKQEGKVVFSFQIAQRSAQLEPPQPSPWHGVLLDTFNDLVASKMVALVERGAPRDFRDIYALFQEGLVTPARCWRLWRRRQELSGSDADAARARLAVGTHLSRIEQHRPLAGIGDIEAKATAEQVRLWFKTEFLDALKQLD